MSGVLTAASPSPSSLAGLGPPAPSSVASPCPAAGGLPARPASGRTLAGSTAATLVAQGGHTFGELNQTLIPFFPLMFLPEAFLNGWIITILVLYKPTWVSSFSDRHYLEGK